MTAQAKQVHWMDRGRPPGATARWRQWCAAEGSRRSTSKQRARRTGKPPGVRPSVDHVAAARRGCLADCLCHHVGAAQSWRAADKEGAAAGRQGKRRRSLRQRCVGSRGWLGGGRRSASALRPRHQGGEVAATRHTFHAQRASERPTSNRHASAGRASKKCVLARHHPT